MLTEEQLALIVEPPETNPYFTLPDVHYFIDDTELRRRKSPYTTIVILWGTLAKMSDDSQAQFLLALLKHSEWKPDWQAVAKEWNLAGPKHIKTRLKAIVESHHYTLEDESTITGGTLPQPKPGPAHITPPNQATAKAGANSKQSSATPSSSKPAKAKKRKVDADKKVPEGEPAKNRSKKKATEEDAGSKKSKKSSKKVAESNNESADAETGVGEQQSEQNAKKGKERRDSEMVEVSEADEDEVVDEEA